MDASKQTCYLPDELLVPILEPLLPRDVTVDLQNHDIIVRDKLLPLSLVCKQFRNIATELYYRRNTFLIRRENARSFRYPPFVFGHHVRRLELQLEFYRTGGPLELEGVFRDANDMSRLWRARYVRQMGMFDVAEACDIIRDEPVYTAIRPRVSRCAKTNWQQHFTELDFVRIELRISEEARDYYFFRMKDLPRLAYVPLRARTVQVDLSRLTPSESLPSLDTRYFRALNREKIRGLDKILEAMMCSEIVPKNDTVQECPEG